MTKLGDFIGGDTEDNFADFDLTEIQNVLANLQSTEIISDIGQAERLQQKALRGADILIEYLGKITKTVGILESQINKTKNAISLNYKSPENVKITADIRVLAAGASSEVEALFIKLSRAKASKLVLEKKYDLIIKSHYYFKEIAASYKQTIIGYNRNSPDDKTTSEDKIPHGYE